MADELGELGFLQDEEEDDINEDIPNLKNALLNERSSPEILPYEEQLVLDMHEAIENQQGHIDETRDRGEDLDEDFAVSLYQMEIDRVKYLLVSYLRTRIAKIEKHVLYIMLASDLRDRLSEKELQYAKRYMDMMETHFKETILKNLPTKFASLNDTKENHNMIDEPNLDNFVFCHINDNLGEVKMDTRGDHSTVLEEGDVQILRYRPIRQLVSEGKIQLI